ncbi:MAG: type II toxin-antitoxin system VapC family toxin [Candidatus Riflebacteria bacterium]|nr:type II toxin-antitoxin system VapC family toxin [Candidatus Riflebacteria bacterium]
MVIDTSALIAILLGEKTTARLAQAIANDPKRLMSTMTALETAVVIELRKGPSGGREFDLLVHRVQIETVGMNADQVKLAREAYLRFGKGRHKAGLNLGDCCSYALARYSGEPLLFVGNDFSKTDVPAATY